ncbi:MAG: glycine cleavage system protein GcvH [Anaerolineae bacterium]|nr:glycine cleavage system protein GcvH [Anaerolineae bacterium]
MAGSVPAGLKYTKEHEWAKVEGDVVRVGITEYAQEQLGDVVYVELPQAGGNITQAKHFGVVESVKAASDLFAPLSGSVVEANAALEAQPELINADPYGQGWMVVVRPDDPTAVDELLDADAYQSYLDSLG